MHIQTKVSTPNEFLKKLIEKYFQVQEVKCLIPKTTHQIENVTLIFLKASNRRKFHG